MNWDQIEGNWQMYRGMVKEQWGKITDDDLDVIAGRRDQLIGNLQRTYGIGREEAERQIAKFLSTKKMPKLVKTGPKDNKMSKRGSRTMPTRDHTGISPNTTAQKESDDELSESEESVNEPRRRAG